MFYIEVFWILNSQIFHLPLGAVDARLLALATDRLAHFEKAGIVSEADVLSELGITEEDLVDAGKVVLE